MLGNKHLLTHLFMQEYFVIMKCMVKQMSFIKCISKYSGDEGNIWKFKKYRAQICQLRMTGLTLP